MNQIKYSEGYKYVVEEDYSVQTAVTPSMFLHSDFVRLDSDGMLYIRKGYAWDGPSGPTIDSPDTMRGSLIHDALYQLIRLGKLGMEWREGADKELRRALREDGTPALRAELWYAAVRGCGEEAMNSAYPVFTAP